MSPWHTGGKEQRQHELLTRLAARGFQVDVYTMRWWGKEKHVVRDGMTFHGICPLVPLYTKDRRSILQAVVFALSTLRMVTRRYDVLEVDAIPFLQLFPTRLVAWLRRKPMVVTWHEYWGSQYWTEYLGPLGRLAAFVERTAIRLPDRILAASDGTAQRLREVRHDGLDVHVVTPGIVAATLAATVDQPWTAARPLQLVYAGRLLDHKRVDVAIDASARLAERGIDARLTVIGAGPHAEQLRLSCRRGPGWRIASSSSTSCRNTRTSSNGWRQRICSCSRASARDSAWSRWRRWRWERRSSRAITPTTSPGTWCGPG